MPDLYRTSHRYLAAYLIAKGHPVVEWTQERDYLTFGFALDETGALVQGFYDNTGVVFPQDFIRGLDTIRSIIRGVREKQTNGPEQGGNR